MLNLHSVSFTYSICEIGEVTSLQPFPHYRVHAA